MLLNSPNKLHITMILLFFLYLSLILSCCTHAWLPSSSSWKARKRTRPTLPSSSSSSLRPSLSFLHLSASASTSSSSSSSSSSSPKELVLYNSKTRQKQVFQPLSTSSSDYDVSMYTCGPTVYDAAHIGNFRAFLTYDVLKRVLSYILGYKVKHVCNLTDIDDKIIQRANDLQLPNQHISDLTNKYTDLFFEDLQRLNIVPATVYPKATEHIDEMMDMIVTLHQKGLAYQVVGIDDDKEEDDDNGGGDGGSWYFRTQAQPGYGQQLVQLNYDDMQQQQEENEQEESGKEHFADFCLWKAFKPGFDRHDAAWSCPEKNIALGRPGWHLECSAMARKYFGADNTIDLHGGGIDLKFPHHENEIAQSEGVSDNNKPFCNCWFHNGFVNVGDSGEKMSKSLGNFLTLATACPTAEDVRAYRYLVVSSHYRNPLAFTPAAMKAAKNALKRIDKIKGEIERVLKDVSFDDDNDNQDESSFSNEKLTSELATKDVPAALENFEAALLDDLSMPRAAASLFSLVKAGEKEFKRVAASENENNTDNAIQLDLPGLKAILNAMEQMDRVFGIFYQVPMSDEEKEKLAQQKDETIPTEVIELVSQRSAAKQAKDWELADSLRARIAELGFAIKDVKDGEPIVSRVVD